MFSKYCTSTVHIYSTNGPYRVQAKAKKITARKITTQGVFANTPCAVQHLLYKGGTKGARTEHKSTGVPINFLSQLLKCKSLRQDMNFMCLLLSCCLASLPKRTTFFSLFTLIFQEENLPRGNAECFVTPGIRSEARDAPTAPVTSRYETRESNSIQQPTGKWKLFLFPQGLHALGDVSSCRRNAGALRRQRDSEPFGMSAWGLGLTTNPDTPLA